MSLNSKQREKLSQFREITGLPEKDAKQILQSINWNLERSIEFFFSQEMSSTPVVSSNTKADLIEGLFNKYKSPTSGDIESEGIQSFCDDLGINPLDPVILVISFHFRAETMGVFKKNEFTSGLKALGCDSIQKLKEKIPQLRQQMEDSRTFKQIYNFVFTFSREVGCRNLNFDVAIELWRLLLAGKFQMIERWIAFLQNREKKHDISKDSWEMLLDFLENVQKNGIEAHDPNSSWPILIDEFVESLNS